VLDERPVGVDARSHGLAPGLTPLCRGCGHQQVRGHSLTTMAGHRHQAGGRQACNLHPIAGPARAPGVRLEHVTRAGSQQLLHRVGTVEILPGRHRNRELIA